MLNNPLISVIVPAFGKQQILNQCLDHIAKQTIEKDKIEIIVVDDGSEPPLYTINKDLQIQIITLHKNYGTAYGVNVGIEHSRGKIILLINDDVFLEPNVIANHQMAHALNDIHAIQGYVTWDNRCRTHFNEWLESSGVQFNFRSLDLDGCSYRNFYTCHISIKREVFDHIGLFSDDILYYNDTELGYRFFQNGYNCIYMSNLLGYHLHEYTLKTYCDNRMVKVGMSYPKLAQRVPPENTRYEASIQRLIKQGGVDAQKYGNERDKLLYRLEHENLSKLHKHEIYHRLIHLAWDHGLWSTYN